MRLVIGIVASAIVLSGGPAIPDPCKLVTVAEMEQIVGKLKAPPRRGDPGEVSCDYTLAKDSSWIEVMLHEGDFEAMRRSFGGKSALPAPEFGTDAFVNGNYVDFSAELFVKRGALVLRVSAPKGPTAIETIKAIARKALPRM